jgi:hypothetical protein
MVFGDSTFSVAVTSMPFSDCGNTQGHLHVLNRLAFRENERGGRRDRAIRAYPLVTDVPAMIVKLKWCPAPSPRGRMQGYGRAGDRRMPPSPSAERIQYRDHNADDDQASDGGGYPDRLTPPPRHAATYLAAWRQLRHRPSYSPDDPGRAVSVPAVYVRARKAGPTTCG